jgi:replication factor C large subunit
MSNILCEKYRASCFLDIKGQENAVDEIKAFLKTFPLGKKAAILYGPAGTGKTSLAYALARETNSEILELNASDLRNKEQLEKILKPASEQQSLSGKNKLLLVDEADGLSTSDRGGLPELLVLIEKSKFPIIITANDIWQQKFNLLRKKSELISMKAINYRIVFELIRGIVKKESMNVGEEVLMSIAVKSRGDMRAALNDLQTVFEVNRPQELDERDKEEDIFNVLRQIFKDLVNKNTIGLYDTVNMPLDEILLWLEENIPYEYHGTELARAFEMLSKADVFRGRIYRQQHWRFLVYENIFLSAGIAAAKEQARLGFTAYKKPGRILKIWMNNQQQQKKKSISIKYAEYCHIGYKRAMHDFSIIKVILRNPQMQKTIRLEADEVEYLTKIQ